MAYSIRTGFDFHYMDEESVDDTIRKGPGDCVLLPFTKSSAQALQHSASVFSSPGQICQNE